MLKSKTLPSTLLLLSLYAGVGSVSVMHGKAFGQAKPTRVRAKLDGFDIAPKTGNAANQIGGASRGIGGLALYAPMLGRSYSLTPTFMWGSDDAQAEYTFRMMGPAPGQEEMYSAKVTGGQFTYPADAPALVPGNTYTWQVAPVSDLLGNPISTKVKIVGGAERSQIEASLHGVPGMTQADAKVYVEKRLWYDALTTYSNLIMSDPTKPEYYKARAELYDQLPQTHALADVDLAKAQR